MDNHAAGQIWRPGHTCLIFVTRQHIGNTTAKPRYQATWPVSLAHCECQRACDGLRRLRDHSVGPEGLVRPGTFPKRRRSLMGGDVATAALVSVRLHHGGAK